MPRRKNINRCLLAAIRKGKLSVVRVFIDLHGLSYIQAWSEGYALLCDALMHKHEDVAKLLLERGAKVNLNSDRLYNTPLHFAIINCGIDMVKTLLDKGANVNAKNQYGRTPLYNAIENGETEITELLLANGADFNDRDNYNISPLDFATKRNHLKIMESLLNHGAYVNCEDSIPGKLRSSPLHFAATENDEKTVTLLLQYGANINVRGGNGATPLFIASEQGYEFAVALFLNKGADANTSNDDKVTPLHIAILRGNESIVTLLLQYGANVDNQDKCGQTTLYQAVESGSISIVQEVLKYCPDVNNEINRKCLRRAVFDNRIDCEMITEALLKYGFRITPSDANDFLLLDAAVTKGYLEIVANLLKYGATLHLLHNTKCSQGLTLLQTAVHMQQEEVAKLLILYGANVNAQNNAGKTALFYAIDNADVRMTNLLLTNGANVKNYPQLLSNAVKKNCIEIVEALLDYGVDINHTDNFGRTALHFTILSEMEFFLRHHSKEDQDINVRTEIVRLLLRRGAYVDTEIEEGVTPLHTAVTKGSTEMVTSLLEYNANVNHRSSDGVRPLHIAAKHGFQEITEILLKFGANINAVDACGKSALHIATNMDHEDVVMTLLKYDTDFTKIINIDNQALFSPNHLINYFYSSSVELYDGDSNHFDEANYFSIKNFAHSFTWSVENEEIFKHHLIKLKVANLCPDVPLVKYMKFIDMYNFKDECAKEITKMKLEKIDAKNSFYDILRKCVCSLVKYMNNENTVQILKSEEYQTKFPIYAEMIKSKFLRVMCRMELETKCNNIFHHLCNNTPVLPFECSEIIINYLDEKSIRDLITACSLP